MSLFTVPDGTNFQMNYEKIEGLLPKTTLFIHGNLASNRWWYPAEKVWKSQAADKPMSERQGLMLLAEFRGCGQSSAPSDSSEFDLRLFAKDFVSLLRSLNLGKVNLVGHSTGGLVAALMLSQAPELFEKAILLDPVGAKGIPFQDHIEEAYRLMKLDKKLLASVMAATIYNCDQSSDFFRQIVVEDAFAAIQVVGSMIVKAMNYFDASAEIGMVKNQVLVLHGEKDTLLPLEESRALAQLLENSQFQVIKNHGHCLNVEDPQAFVEIANRYLFN